MKHQPIKIGTRIRVLPNTQYAHLDGRSFTLRGARNAHVYGLRRDGSLLIRIDAQGSNLLSVQRDRVEVLP